MHNVLLLSILAVKKTSSMSDPEKKYRYKPSPQVSANQMAEYLTATPPRRKSIIQAARFPKTSVIALYGRARDGLTNFLGDGTRSFKHMAQAVDYLQKREARPDASEWLQNDSRSSIEAIERFQQTYNKLPFPKLDCQAVTNRVPALDLWMTKVTVDVDVTVHKGEQIGGAVFLFSQGDPSSKKRIERCKTIAGLIYVFASQHLKGIGEPDVSLCYAIDVFAGMAHRPSGAFTAKQKQIAEACEEIAARWKTIAPPADYDGPDPS